MADHTSGSNPLGHPKQQNKCCSAPGCRHRQPTKRQTAVPGGPNTFINRPRSTESLAAAAEAAAGQGRAAQIAVTAHSGRRPRPRALPGVPRPPTLPVIRSCSTGCISTPVESRTSSPPWARLRPSVSTSLRYSNLSYQDPSSRVESSLDLEVEEALDAVAAMMESWTPSLAVPLNPTGAQ